MVGTHIKKPLRVGLTGGIGSGKSTVCKFFSELNVPVIDADQIAHKLVQPGQPALNKIRDTFGDKYINAEGKLDRKRLRTAVFQDDKVRRQLEKILHPLVYNEIEHQIALINTPYCIVCIPLLIETDSSGHVDRVLVIDLPEKLQIERASQRDQAEPSEILKIIQTQAPRDSRLAVADDIIQNDKTEEQLQSQVNKLHEDYMKITADRIASPAQVIDN